MLYRRSKSQILRGFVVSRSMPGSDASRYTVSGATSFLGVFDANLTSHNGAAIGCGGCQSTM